MTRVLHLLAVVAVAGCQAGESAGMSLYRASPGEVLHSGDEIALIVGPQGGVHAELSLAVDGAALGAGTLEVSGTFAPGQYPVELEAVEEEIRSTRPVRLFLCPADIQVDGTLARFAFDLTDAHGDAWTAALDLVPRCAADDSLCIDLCAAR